MSEFKDLTFEDAMKRLDEIIAKMEGGNVPLEKSVEMYEMGMKLKEFCSTKLNEARLKVEQIENLGDGKVALKEFNVE